MFKIITHRGHLLPKCTIHLVQDKYQIPENTLEAFKKAFKSGWGKLYCL